MLREDGLNRPKRSLREIEELPRLGGSEIVEHLRQKGNDLSPETLVYLFREFRDDGRVRCVNLTAELLLGERDSGGGLSGGCCESTIRSIGRKFGLANERSDLGEFRQRIYGRLVEHLLAGRDARPFWEERFYRALKDLAIDVGRSLIRERKRYVDPPSSGEEEPPDIDSFLPENADSLESSIFEELGADAIRNAIKELPEKQRIAAWLTWVKDFQIESKKSDRPTVSTLMDISPSMVRRHLRKARAALRKRPEIATLLKDTQ